MAPISLEQAQGGDDPGPGQVGARPPVPVGGRAGGDNGLLTSRQEGGRHAGKDIAGSDCGQLGPAGVDHPRRRHRR